MRIFLIHPTTENLSADAAQAIAPGEGTEVAEILPESGPPALESGLDAAAAIPPLLEHVSDAQAQSADAIVLNCVGDPGLVPARDISRAPVVGPGQTAMTIAALLADSFSVIVPDDGSVTIIARLARVYGLSEKLCSVRSLHSSVREIQTHTPDVLEQLAAAACAAIEADGAHAIVLGCAAFAGLEAPLRAELEERGQRGIPVVEPVSTALRIAQALARLGLSHSKRSHPEPTRPLTAV